MFHRINRKLLLCFPIGIALPAGVDLGFNITIAEVFVAYWAFVLIAIRLGVSKNRPNAQLPRTIWWWLIFCIMAIFSIIVNPINSEGVIIVVRFCEAGVLMILTYKLCIYYKPEKQELLNSLVTTSLACAIFAIIQSVFGIGALSQKENTDFTRVSGIGGGGSFGAILGSGLVVLIVAVFIDKSLKAKIISLGKIALIIAGLLLTFSKTWLFSFVIVFGIALVWNKQAKTILFGGYIFVLIVSIFLVQVDNIDQYTDQQTKIGKYLSVINLFEGNLEQTSMNTRSYKWASSWDIFTSKPILGVGPENLDIEFAAWVDQETRGRSDSQYLDLLSMYGILGFLAFFFTIRALWKRLFFGIRRSSGTLNIMYRILVLVVAYWLIGGVFWAILYHHIGIFFGYVIALMVYLTSPNILEISR